MSIFFTLVWIMYAVLYFLVVATGEDEIVRLTILILWNIWLAAGCLDLARRLDSE